ncbi:MAG: hypothetical protein RLZZ385_1935 [Pseudomonadota bacterium]|jgi:polyhydroxybutyrate depolymerase
MRTLTLFLLGLICSWGPALAAAQSIDAGRGELPLTVPATYNPATPAPLIVLLHGYGSSGARQDGYMQFSALADHYGFLFVAPDGRVENGGEQRRFWNASEACCNFYGSEEDDAAYVLAIINTVKNQYSVDANRVYLIGHSNGGFMSYRTAHEHADVIAAIASIAGAEATVPRPAPAVPVHVLQIHGTNDGTIDYEGADIRGNPYPGAVETVERWATYNGCEVSGHQVAMLDLEDSLPGLDSTVVRYDRGCRAGGSSELWTIINGPHVPAVSDSFSRNVVDWLMAHPKVRTSDRMAAD